MNDVRDPVDDAQLMAHLATGDRTALGTLVKRHQRRVLELAFRTTGDHALAEDIGQEAFLRVWRSAKRYEPTAQFTTWLYRIVVNLCLDAFKRRKPTTGDVPDAIDSGAAGQATEIEQRERGAAVQRAVTALPDRQRVAVVLHRFSGLTVRLTAEATGWSESAVESLLVRAYSVLRQSLKELDKK
ncbi:MAG: sigma-70 family RNA polymerase sigma factor [Phycisphaerae bacterium]